ncbi:hypothetical protein [Emticicia sp. 21SJ11W-3]|uniref:hypothetical protein n=1 Tax=Emticicia sp. 21SJ11W-3 TaxID=2916755 RepID=UPI0020A1D4A3|nr:hypothetical protein [Emticicia sp. 21SJ11W-3]UTA66246.1 hypothetical protein MB380_11575 [Emticicia sp. 21SJ11W-3]
MAIFSKRSFVWIIVLSFLGIILLPGMIQSPSTRHIILAVFGSICLLFQLISMATGGNSAERNPKTDRIQSIVLLILTITLLVVNFLV